MRVICRRVYNQKIVVICFEIVLITFRWFVISMSDNTVDDTSSILLNRLRDITEEIEKLGNMGYNLNVIHGNSLGSKIHTLSQFQGNERYTMLNSDINALKNKKMKLELDVARKKDEFEFIQQELIQETNKIESLQKLELDSKLELTRKLHMVKKKLQIEHENRLSSLNEKYQQEIKQTKQNNVEKFNHQLQEVKTICEDLSNQLKQAIQDSNRKMIRLIEDQNKSQIQSIQAKDDEINQCNQRITDICEKNKQLESEIQQRQLENESINQEVHQLCQDRDDIKSKSDHNQQIITQLQDKLNSKIQQIADIKQYMIEKKNQKLVLIKSTLKMNEEIMMLESTRRTLHNKLQELKGNIRVFCRIRPVFNQERLISLNIPEDELNDEGSQQLTLESNGRTHKFYFDKIFSQELTNESIFDEIWQLIQSSLDGFNVCVFAYGQTGSGKTYTMSQPKTGVIPLSIEKIFNSIDDLKANGWEYTIQGQFIEIYNENIIDLLSPRDSGRHEIKHDENSSTTTISNVTSIEIVSYKQATTIFERAVRNRSTASTKSNERSSRSHSIFILKINGFNSKTNEKSKGTLNLVDLAGSERLNSSQATGERRKETQAINKSLSALGDVIYSLGEKQNSQSSSQNHHIPYRNSKLTYLLKHSLGGNSKTLMFVNMSPLEKDFNESVNSLRFASKVNTTKLQRATSFA